MEEREQAQTNGAGAAAVVAAGIGALAIAILGIAGDHVPGFGKMMIFYGPTGPLSGVTTTGIVMWLASWGLLDWRWRKKTVSMGAISKVAVALLLAGLLLTFPPLANLF